MTSIPPCPAVPTSWGELIDKLTILEIKRDRIPTAVARGNVARELALLAPLAASALAAPGIATLADTLRRVNALLWDVEDAIRIEERQGRFGNDFIALARAVYQRNDERAAIKRAINDRLGSALVEEKCYACAEAAAGAVSA